MKKFLKISAIIIGSLIIIFIAIIYASFYSNLWMYYPNPFKTQTALSRLEMSTFSDPICHQDCFEKREIYKNIISDYALKNNDVKEQIKNLILDHDVFVDFQVQLVQVLRQIVKKEKQKNNADQAIIPPFLLSYLYDKDAKGDVQQEIMNQFSDIQNNKLLKSLQNIATNYNIDEEERAEAINTIGNIGNNEDYVEFLMKIIEDPKNSNRIRYTTARKLPTLLEDKKIKLTKNMVDRAIKLALDKNIDNHISVAALDIAYYYDSQDKKYLIKLIKKVYLTTSNKFIKDKAADILHGLGEKQFKNPIITDKEWDDYYNNDLFL